MAASHWIVLLLSVAYMFPHTVQKSLRTKRNLVDLYKIVKCTTHENALIFALYGCYCGLGGKGEPLDDIDRCCFYHDRCYAEAESETCNPKVDHYHWTCQGGAAKCSEATKDSCEDLLCKCDTVIAECLHTHIHSFNQSLVLWPKMIC